MHLICLLFTAKMGLFRPCFTHVLHTASDIAIFIEFHNNTNETIDVYNRNSVTYNDLFWVTFFAVFEDLLMFRLHFYHYHYYGI